MQCPYCGSNRPRQHLPMKVLPRRERRTRFYFCPMCHRPFETIEAVLAHPVIDPAATLLVTPDGLAIELENATLDHAARRAIREHTQPGKIL